MNAPETGEISSQASITGATLDANPNNNATGPVSIIAINPEDLITNITVRQVSEAVEISWEATTEVIAVGYNLYRSGSQTGERTRLNPEPVPTQTPGRLVSIGHSYLDTSATPGRTYYYWVEMIDRNGETIEEGISLSTFNYLFLPSVMRMIF